MFEVMTERMTDDRSPSRQGVHSVAALDTQVPA